MTKEELEKYVGCWFKITIDETWSTRPRTSHVLYNKCLEIITVVSGPNPYNMLCGTSYSIDFEIVANHHHYLPGRVMRATFSAELIEDSELVAILTLATIGK